MRGSGLPASDRLDGRMGNRSRCYTRQRETLARYNQTKSVAVS